MSVRRSGRSGRSEKTMESEYVVVLDPNKDMDHEFEAEVGHRAAKEFAFKLDWFQMQAIIHLERHSNVLVSAHTSAGKTVVADYAIAMAFRSSWIAIIHLERHSNVLVSAHTSAGKTVVADYAIAMAFRSHSRVVYTSPIKALSNQKYRDFKKDFGDVGLLTGDVQIDTDSKCLIMTTEILLQMLYNRSEVIDKLEYVVFDECHYVNDPERGHVWEEVFILLPQECSLVLLSATVPNVVQFADWLGRTRRKKTYVVSTSKRPVPLQHYLYMGRDGKSKNDRHMIVDENGLFINDNYKKCEQIIGDYKLKCPQTERQIYLNLIRHLEEKDQLPAILFTLSRNRCDSNLENLMAISSDSFRLINKAEEARIHNFVWYHLRRLKPCDQKLPQIVRTVEMLKRGLGVHHSGVLPILKELTEILFSEGLIKVLVATETFAMGVNMPARTVVFDSIDKHDGNNWRDLLPSEYIQMAGRAGRRGKDLNGTVIILCKYDIPDSPRLTRMIQGSANQLVSQFRLTYHMICNLHKTCKSDETDIEKFLERSFGEHNRLKQSTDVMKELDLLRQQIETFAIQQCPQCADIDTFCRLFDQYVECLQVVMPSICQRALEKGKLNIGRIIAVVGNENPFETAIVVRVNKDKYNQISNLTVLSLALNGGP
ncbi:unnamed protein product, partial [Medioppia subpectinata]